MSSSPPGEDEFDDLFSFSVASSPKGTTPKQIGGSGTGTASTSTSGATADTAALSGVPPPPAQVPTTTTTTPPSTNANSNTNGAASTTTSDTESYCKVSVGASITPPSDDGHNGDANDNDNDNDDDDDIFGDFNLDAIQLNSSTHAASTATTVTNATNAANAATTTAALKEEDFNGMDEGTREFLDFLDKDDNNANVNANTNTSANTNDGGTNAAATNDGNGGADLDINMDMDMDMDMDVDDILGVTNTQVKVLNDAGDILAGLENDSSDEESEDEDNNGFVTVNSKEENDNGNTASAVAAGTSAASITAASTATNASSNSNLASNVSSTGAPSTSTATNVDLSPSKPKVTFPPPSLSLSKAQPPKRYASHDSHLSINNNKPTVVKLPTLPRPNKNRRASSSSSIQMNSILASVDSELSSSSSQQQQQQLNQKQQSNNDNESNSNFSIDIEEEEVEEDANEVVVEEKIEEVKEIVFDSFMEALQSPESTIHHIRPFIYNPKKISSSKSSLITSMTKEDRPYLWSKVICAKVLQDVKSSSLVDAFVSFHEDLFDYEKFCTKQENYDLEDEVLVSRILEEVDILSHRIVYASLDNDGNNNNHESSFKLDDDDDDDDGDNNNGNGEERRKAKSDLCSLLVFYYRSTSNLGNMKKVNTFASILKSPEGDSNSNDDKGTDEDGNENENNATVVSEKEGDATKDTNAEKQGDEEEKVVDTSEEKLENTNTVPDNENKMQDGDTDVDEEETAKSATNTIEWKSLIGPIAATLLSAGIPIEVASVMLSKIISTLPLISLTKFERFTAIKSLHQQLYFLVCYHLPLLVLHLDRYAPGWHWPRTFDVKQEKDETESGRISPTQKSRNLEAHGTIPITWFASLMAGEGTSETLDQRNLLCLWDVLLTSDDQSLKFFLALAVLEKHADSLMMLRGQDLIDELSAVMSLKTTSKIDDESFLGSPRSDTDLSSSSNTSDEDFVLNWYQDAKMLQETTPLSVTSDLRKAEDKAVDHILIMRSKHVMEKMTARLEAEAEAHKQAVKEENERKAEARQYQYYKKRLEIFYAKHCPEKKETVDTILNAYKDRYLLLDKKLNDKYGSGFLPLIAVFNPKLQNQTSKLIANMGQGIEKRKKNIVVSRAKEIADKLDKDMMGPGAHQVAIKVSANEMLPFVCGGKSKRSGAHQPLKYYLVDSRPNETVKVQGAFPTSVRLSPKDLMEPDSIQEKVDMFESLRGAVHICIMGEGFSSFPTLYDHPLSKAEEKLLENDESRTNMCALFFIKKGFPFISVLNGGFAAAHSWLARDCDYLTLTKVLVDYDEQSSLFADLERSHQAQKEYSNASTRRKTSLALQKLIDNSMTRLTVLENRIEEFTDRPRGRGKLEPKEEEDNSSLAETQVQTETKKKTMKLPPMRLFKLKKTTAEPGESKSINGNDDTSSVRGEGEEESLQQKEAPVEAQEHEKINAMKSGFNKAFTGFRKARANKTMEPDKEEDEKTNTEKKSQAKLPEKDDGEPTESNSGFNFRKINFSRKKNIFARKPKQTDELEDLEKEIEASLTRPDDAPPTQTLKPDTPTKGKAKPNTPKKSSNNPFKNPLKKMSLNKFGSIATNRPSKSTSQSIIREEESLFFEEESLDGTEDAVSIQTNDMDEN